MLQTLSLYGPLQIQENLIHTGLRLNDCSVLQTHLRNSMTGITEIIFQDWQISDCLKEMVQYKLIHGHSLV